MIWNFSVKLTISLQPANDGTPTVGNEFCERLLTLSISHLDHKMKEANLYRTYSMQQLLDRLDVLECFEDKGHKLRIGELMTKQADIYEALGATLPTSSC